MKFIYSATIASTFLAAALCASASPSTSEPAYKQKIKDAKATLADIAGNSTAENAHSDIDKSLKAFKSALGEWKSYYTAEAGKNASAVNVAVIQTDVKDLEQEFFKTLKEIVGQDFLSMKYYATKPTNASDYSKNMSSIHATDTSSVNGMLDNYDETVKNMESIISDTQHGKTLIDEQNKKAGAAVDQKTGQTAVDSTYRGADRSATNVAAFAQSLLRSDGMTLMVSACTTVFAAIAVASAFVF